MAVEFVAIGGDRPLTCNGDIAAITDLRFFVSEIRLTSDGGDTPLRLDADESWQSDSVALVDLENGQGNCQNGTDAVNVSIRGTARAGDYSGIAFTVGVPFDLNHRNPLTAEAPLDNSDMHWHWRSGYKFMRAGITTADRSFWIHLGSTGCNGTVQNIEKCSAPNRVNVQLPDFDLERDRVFVDLGLLLRESGDCSSGPGESSCARAFRMLGLPHAGAGAVQKQRVFGVLR